MNRKLKGMLLATGVVAVLGAGGAAIAGATGGDDKEADRPIRGHALDKARTAALGHTGGGRVTETEVGDEEGAYELEVTTGDGSQVDVHLDRRFRLLGTEDDEDRSADAQSADRPTLPQGSEAVRLDPADFTTRIDNPWWPMRVGTRWVYRETTPDGTRQRVVVTVTPRTKRIANGVVARVVHDVVTENGKPVEVTDDWYAQDKAGNIWYLGEFTKEYENGKFKNTGGSFEAGVDGAQAGVIMPAKPRPGLRYRQEYYKGEAEDKGSIVSLREQAEVPFGHFRRGRVLMTRDTNPLEPKILEFKFYARGVGPVLAVGISGGADREELVSFRRR